jgi:NAD(P)-dependent dehydrogenase (short-subunit alcohol dehydrogenase family)/uncharacterized OB-fold protein
MIEALQPPPKKDPQARTRNALLPPRDRSRATMKMAASAARGTLELQTCSACQALVYPPRDACPKCLGADLPFKPVTNRGQLIAESTVQTTTDTYFRERTPWRMGTVLLDGPQPIPLTVHLHDEVGEAPCAVRLRAFLDKTANVVLMAMPPETSRLTEDDPQLRELTATPKHRRVVVSDARTPVGRAVVQAVIDAGATMVFAGNATPWLPFEGEAELAAHDKVHLIPMDITDDNSVRVQAGEIGAKCDILINTADHVREGGVLSRQGLVTSHDEFEVNVFGLQRLAQYFGPIMIGRGADGINSAAAFVDILSVYAFCNWRQYGAHSASAAARHSLLQCLRGELNQGGVRVMGVFTGPVEHDWYQPLPPPKLAPAAVAKAVVTALNEGIEESWVGDIARDVREKWQDSPKALERELTL